MAIRLRCRSFYGRQSVIRMCLIIHSVNVFRIWRRKWYIKEGISFAYICQMQRLNQDIKYQKVLREFFMLFICKITPVCDFQCVRTYVLNCLTFRMSNLQAIGFNLLKPTGYVMHQQFNLLKPAGYVMHQQFNLLKPTGYVMHQQCTDAVRKVER